jgi:predicted secreted protein
MARNDPTDTGGLFIGRRPGTARVHYANEPEGGSPGRRRVDRAVAVFVLVVETLVCLTLWGPQPVGWLWVGSQVNYQTGSVSVGIVVAFAGMIATLMLTLALAVRLDAIWKVVRRAAGYDQREGVLPRIFMITAIVAAVAFGFWFLIIQGPGPTLAPTR